MKAAVAPSPNAPWEVREIPTPEPGPGQVLIRIRASGLCYTDVHLSQAHLPAVFPAVFGHEPVGEIVSVGPGVTSRKAGDRVGVPWVQRTCGRCEWCLREKPDFCSEGIGTGVNIHGGHAEYMVAWAEATMPIPAGLSWEQAAPIFCAGYTVWSGLRLAEPQPGERVAVVGIGGLGHLAVQYAKAAGFETIAITRSRDKEAMILELGADHVVPDGASLAAHGGADVILGTSNSNAAMGDTLQGLRPDGRFVLMGFDASTPLPVPGTILMQRARILGSHQNRREHLYEALRIAAQGRVRIALETFPLDEIARAYRAVETGAVRFRAVVLP